MACSRQVSLILLCFSASALRFSGSISPLFSTRSYFRVPFKMALWQVLLSMGAPKGFSSFAIEVFDVES